ncbi:hypothetical protein [Pseudomonas sp. dw_358]|uniref:hypothetical protein n=1 Tax=Pseudomonas sp. dw_358 TaxID=2720083 RepID=UPI001BD270BD|nr:hypothetical protein [Pseudomonas sp. dw_358]
MTAHIPDIPDAETAEAVGIEKTAVPAFSFPFNPAKFADAAKKAPNYPGAGKSTHDKTPGRAPNGTRRSMGKR